MLCYVCCGCVWFPPIIFIGTHRLVMVEMVSTKILVTWDLSLLLQLCQNGRSLISAREVHSSVPLALLNDRPF
ncbi:hypothetical protein SFRURICE_009290 [Spodoptera frugiperda]|nr:hypothetical protein SFRURICE_009290 [Spodoptera frugiperda]